MLCIQFFGITYGRQRRDIGSFTPDRCLYIGFVSLLVPGPLLGPPGALLGPPGALLGVPWELKSSPKVLPGTEK